MSNPFPDIRVDTTFNYALVHFLRIRGLSALSFCRRTAELSPERHKLILPTQITKWRRDQMPSARAVMIAARTFGVPRSFFYLTGELIESGRLHEDEPEDRVRQQLAVLEAAIEEAPEKDLLVLEAAIRRRRLELDAEKE
jgi:hypothetical protein